MPQPLFKVSAYNFRSLRDVEVELRPLNVLVGPNASGKSNFLDVIRFLGDSAREDLQGALAMRGGWKHVFFRGVRKATSRPEGPELHEIEIKIDAAVTRYASRSAPDEYTLRFWPGVVKRRAGEEDVFVRSEWFRFKRTKGRGRRVTIRGRRVEFVEEGPGEQPQTQLFPLREGSLGLSTLPRLAPERGGTEVARTAAFFTTLRVFDVDVAAARLPSVDPISEHLEADASNLASFLAHLLTAAPDSYERLQEDARAMIPGLNEIVLRAVGGPQIGVAVELDEAGLDTPTELGDASYGTIRTLALLAMLYDPDPPSITCIEEIDHGLHPYVFDRLAELLREASERTQFLIATHSPAFVNRLHPSELIVVERDGDTGETIIPAIDAGQVEAVAANVRGEAGLGEIWFSGTLGGVPH